MLLTALCACAVLAVAWADALRRARTARRNRDLLQVCLRLQEQTWARELQALHAVDAADRARRRREDAVLQQACHVVDTAYAATHLPRGGTDG